jgi:uracil-DNA glycosylase
MTQSFDPQSETAQELAAYLGFWADQGIDLLFDDTPHNLRLEENKSPLRLVSGGQEDNRPSVAEVSANVNSFAPSNRNAPDLEAIKHDAQVLIDASTSLESLYAALEGFDATPLRNEGGRKFIRGRGVEKAALMIIGEPPTKAEDDTGEAFQGPEGRLIDLMLKAAGLSDSVYLCHAAFWKPAGQRPLTDEDFALNYLFLKAIIARVNPSGVLLMGACAARSVLGVNEGILKLRAQSLTLGAPGLTRDEQGPLPAAATYAPQFLLRQPQAKAMAWADLLRLKKALNVPHKS